MRHHNYYVVYVPVETYAPAVWWCTYQSKEEAERLVNACNEGNENSDLNKAYYHELYTEELPDILDWNVVFHKGKGWYAHILSERGYKDGEVVIEEDTPTDFWAEVGAKTAKEAIEYAKKHSSIERNPC